MNNGNGVHGRVLRSIVVCTHHGQMIGKLKTGVHYLFIPTHTRPLMEFGTMRNDIGVYKICLKFGQISCKTYI